MELLDWLHFVSGTLFLASALYKIYKRQAEHFFTRFLVSAWFFLTVFEQHFTVEFVRAMSNYVIMLIPLIEVISPISRRYWRGKR